MLLQFNVLFFHIFPQMISFPKYTLKRNCMIAGLQSVKHMNLSWDLHDDWSDLILPMIINEPMELCKILVSLLFCKICKSNF